jgi:hypothetical protein
MTKVSPASTSYTFESEPLVGLLMQLPASAAGPAS